MIFLFCAFLFTVFMALWTHRRKLQARTKKEPPMTAVTAPVPAVAAVTTKPHVSFVQRVEALATSAEAEVGKIDAYVVAEVEKVAAPLRADLAAAEAQVVKLEGVIASLASKMAGQSCAQDTAIAAAAVEAAVPVAAPEVAAAAAVVEAAFTAADAPQPVAPQPVAPGGQ